MNPRYIIILLVLLAVGSGLFFYLTRPVALPTQDIKSEVTPLPTTSTNPTEKQLSIVSSESEAKFSLNEDLRGVPTLVVGTTKELGGTINLQVTAPAKLTIGEVKINARTLKTDDEKRNGALGRFILKSEDPANEFIVFQPKTVVGIPETIAANKEFAYTIHGDLTIRGTTKPVTFNATSTLLADGSLRGNATSTITYGDFGLSVPDLPFLANVEKTVKLEISLIAR